MTTSAWAWPTHWPPCKRAQHTFKGTVNGYGERTGNCNLTSLIPNIALKLKLRCISEASLAQLKDLSQFVDEIAQFTT